MRTTVIYAPHPDDEVLYLCAYIRGTAYTRGDRIILAAVSDGEGSGSKPADWTVQDLVNIRVAEQTSAMRVLAGSDVMIHRLGLPDAEDAASLTEIHDGVKNFASAMERMYTNSSGDTVEHYGACGYVSTQSAHHQAVANGIRDAGVTVARFAADPRQFTQGSIYTPSAGAVYDGCVLSDDIYAGFGHISVNSAFTALRSNGYKNRIYP